MKLSVYLKMTLGFALVVLLTGIVAWIGLKVAADENATTEEIMHHDVTGLVELSSIVGLVHTDRELLLRHIGSDDGIEKTRFEAELLNIDRRIGEALDVLDRTWDLPAKLKGLKHLRDTWGEYVRLRNDRIIPMIIASPDEETRAKAESLADPKFQEVATALDDLVEINRTSAADRLQESFGLYESGRKLILIMVAAAVLICLITAMVLSRAIAGGVGAVARAARDMAAGDLTQRVRITSKDELGEMATSFNTMAASMSSITEQLQEAATSLAGASVEILATITQQSASASEQSAAVTQTSSTVAELQAMVEQATERVREVAAMAQQAAQFAQSGREAVTETVSGMREIRAKVEVIAHTILGLSEQTQAIGEITATVNDLADQSNLLALNAAIEAARAGEAGRGFGVVAGEVRNLAEQSRAATAQVKSILGDIQKAAHKAVMVTEEGIKGVEAGMARVNKTGEVINRLADLVRDSAQAAQHITASAEQQQAGMAQIRQAMVDITQASSQSVASTHQSKMAAENINDLAEQLRRLVSRYRLDKRGA